VGLIIVSMTTIAYRNGILAADTLVTEQGRRVGRTTKIFRHGELLWGFAGALQHRDVVASWLSAGLPGDTPLMETRKGARSDALIIFDGRLICFDEHGADSMALPQFYAIGSGAPYALGAMAHGASAEEAVRAAMNLDLYTGGDVTVLSHGAI